MQSPLFLHERTSLVATCSPKLAEEGGRRKAEAIRHALGDRDPLREALNRFCGLLPDGLFDYPTGKSVTQPVAYLSSPFGKNISVFPKYKSGYMICRLVPLEGRIAIVTDAGRDAVDADGAFDESA